jgi:hypothetical protein
MSDHMAVLFNINVKATRSFKPSHKVYIYKKADFVSFNKFMLQASEDNPQDNSPSENWNNFKSIITKSINDYVPHKKSAPRFKLQWINSTIKQHMRKKDRLHKKALIY